MFLQNKIEPMEEAVKKGNYTVAFFDILGFKEMVNTMPLDKLVEKYEYIFIEVANSLNFHYSPESKELSFFPHHPLGKPFCIKYIFSDSIMLFSNESSAESCLKLLIYSWKLFQTLLAFGFPARGAITRGEVYVNNVQKIFLGKALTAAYELAEKQQWIGACIDTTIFNEFPELSELIKSENYVLRDLFFEYDVPIKDESCIRMHTLNWRWNLIVEKGTRSLFPQSVLKDVTVKQNNSLEYAKQFVSTGRIYMQNQDKIPVELRAMWVGAKEPPFKHGDEL
ncbi:MAG: hypothetical protein A2077_01980 [Nitrospirae bacterium GWC2_46_6]|nr:MAG: hypothetical protein A2077_01980 [Nitrospirae bacterium GWC2_46_6]OGW21123.1 MAG: hypothetical protein A2Z82_00710 [Nitrospirae bacterium GWA2_46_11]OGW23832.1 MAG: hypothetical protein A2X55_12025 [Nitrospirae bacterium GWB2_47_37]HAK88496.1 hypothetical protein [Nitrospiraceae bacterium]HCL81510.1 hypothetical protein [Nitrospiraceae bacterium]